MSRQPRAGKAAHPVTIRATTGERARWKSAAKAEGCPTLSAWVVLTLNERVAHVVLDETRRNGR